MLCLRYANDKSTQVLKVNSKTFLRFSGSHGSGNLKKEAEIFLWKKKLNKFFLVKCISATGHFVRKRCGTKDKLLSLNHLTITIFFFFAQQNEKNVNK